MMFPPKIPYGPSVCNIHIGAIIWPPNILAMGIKLPLDPSRPQSKLYGVEIRLMNLIARRLNLAPIYHVYGIEENWGNVYSYQIATGIFGALFDGDIDVALGTVSLTEDRYRFLDISVQYLQV